MNFNNKEVTAVKFTGVGLDLKQYTREPVKQIKNKDGTIMWESVWRTTQVLRVKIGSQLSALYPNCYYASGVIMLEKYLALVVLSTSDYATNSWVYNQETGELSYIIYNSEPLVETATVIACYKYLDRYDKKPIVTWNIISKDINTCRFTCTYTFINNNNETCPMYINMYDEQGSIIYSSSAAISGNNSKSTSITLIAREVKILLTFSAVGFIDSTSVYYLYPFN